MGKKTPDKGVWAVCILNQLFSCPHNSECLLSGLVVAAVIFYFFSDTYNSFIYNQEHFPSQLFVITAWTTWHELVALAQWCGNALRRECCGENFHLQVASDSFSPLCYVSTQTPESSLKNHLSKISSALWLLISKRNNKARCPVYRAHN